ncbi:MAG: glycosyltransferase family 4 protein [Candidatus ainarchaeum sp.]|nr:glycosyltransferase family 4 protein [Candidatus ainarchaeum sp.]
MNENLFSTYNYPKNVQLQIDQDDRDSYLLAAEKLNKCKKTMGICIQHEFGLFGGTYGDYLIPFMEEVKKPIVTTFHSILDPKSASQPQRHIRYVVKKIAENSHKVVVISGYGKDILMQKYKIPEEKIAIVPHGVPFIQFGKTAEAKKELGLEGKKVMSSFGLLSNKKGIQYALKALPGVVEKNPDLLYLVIGETHPLVRKREGEKYRNKLKKMVNDLGLKGNVMFYNKYLPLEEICKYLQATDVYITPYFDPQQISSGTLAYAIGAGKACISTPYLYAKDALRHERGILVPFKNAKAIGTAVNRVLSDRKYREKIEKNAYNYSRAWTWPKIADSYVHLFRHI